MDFSNTDIVFIQAIGTLFIAGLYMLAPHFKPAEQKARIRIEQLRDKR